MQLSYLYFHLHFLEVLFLLMAVGIRSLARDLAHYSTTYPKNFYPSFARIGFSKAVVPSLWFDISRSEAAADPSLLPRFLPMTIFKQMQYFHQFAVFAV
jgi:hypothetical protein